MKITIKNLCKSYDGVTVLDNINLTFESNRPVCLMGPSGRGKTTLISIMLGLVKADSGEIISEKNIRYSAVFQEDRLCEELSAIMNIAIVQEKTDREKLQQMLMEVGLEKEETVRPVSTLSGGQKRRVAILRALVSDSDAVIMDEPFKGLDENTKQLVVDTVLKYIGSRLLLVITHNEEDAAALGADTINL